MWAPAPFVTRVPSPAAVHAAGKVPVLVDGDFTLGESHAIMAYIVRTKCSRGMAERWYPSASKVRARIDEWMHWHHSNLRRGASSTLMYTMGLAEARGLHPDGAAVEEKILRSALRHMNSALTGAKFLAGTEHATVADLSAAAELSMLELVPTRFIDEPQFSAVKAWYDRMQRLESWGPAHAVLYKVVAKLRGSRL